MKKLIILCLATLAFVACNNPEPEVGGMAHNNYFFRVVNNTTRADFELGFTSASGKPLVTYIVAGPGGSSSSTLGDIFALSGCNPDAGVYLHPSAHDLTTDTWVDLESEGISNFSNEGVVVTLSYFLGRYSVSYEYVSRIN